MQPEKIPGITHLRDYEQMTNLLPNPRTVLPAPVSVQCVSPRRLDYLRIAWWMFKASRFNPVVVCLGVLILSLSLILFIRVVGEYQSPRLAISLAAIAILLGAYVALMLGTILILAISVFFQFNMKDHQAYMDGDRNAVLLLIGDPVARKWRVRNHVVAKTRKGYGHQLRRLLVPQAQAIASSNNVVIYGIAENKKVMAIYVKQLSPYGFRSVGKKRIQWP